MIPTNTSSIARNGHDHLNPDLVLDMSAFMNKLLQDPTSQVSLNDLQHTRVHRALLLISGTGTRWPPRLITCADTLLARWRERFGPLEKIRPFLYDKGGRLGGMHEERDLSRHVRGLLVWPRMLLIRVWQALLVKWLSDPSTLISPLQAMESGHLDFKPGRYVFLSLFIEQILTWTAGGYIPSLPSVLASSTHQIRTVA